MQKFLVLPIYILLNFSIATAQSDEAAVRSLLTEQTTQWNKGDLTAFMGTYWNNDSLMFIGKSGINYGWQKTLDNYKKNYPDTAAMGNLQFELLEVKRLSAAYFFVVGKWHLTRSIGDIGGSFTLLFRKIKHQWLIVADHST